MALTYNQKEIEMGMDVYGRNPKLNKKIEDFPVYHKYKDMDLKDKWKKLDKDEELRDQYHKEWDEFENSNPGVYFRNNCWWWRPLWDYCYYLEGDVNTIDWIISEKLYEEGHSNSGAGLNAEDAKKLGQSLLLAIHRGDTIKYQAEYMQEQEELDEKDFNKHYPFDVDNVKEFAEFCIDSGGFEIC